MEACLRLPDLVRILPEGRHQQERGTPGIGQPDEGRLGVGLLMLDLRAEGVGAYLAATRRILLELLTDFLAVGAEVGIADHP